MFWSPFKQKILVAANICCKTIAWVAVMFLPAPQESLKGAIIFGTPMVLAGQSSLPTCGARSQPGAVRAGIRYSAPRVPGMSEDNFICLLKWPKRKPPSVTHRAPFSNRWSVQALLGFPEAAPAPPLPPGEPGRGSSGQTPWPRAAPVPGPDRSSRGSSVWARHGHAGWRPRPPGPQRCAGGEGAQASGPGRGAIHQQDGYCWEEFLPGGMNLQWLFSGAGDVPLLCGQGHGWARGWTLPHPLTPSSTPTHAPRRELGLRGAQRPPNPPLLHSGFTGAGGCLGSAPLHCRCPLMYSTKLEKACLSSLGRSFVPCWRVLPPLNNFVLISSWPGPSRPDQGLSPAKSPLPLSDYPRMHKPKENCRVTLGLCVRWGCLLCFGGVSGSFCLMALEAPARLGDCADILESCDKGCRRRQFLFLNSLVWLCCAGGNNKETEAQGQQLNLCAFLYFFLLLFFFQGSFQCACLLGPQGITCSGNLLHCL